MRVHAIGLGGAGCRIVDRLVAAHGDEPFLHGCNAFDTDAATLESLHALDSSRRYRFGDAAGGGGLNGDLHAGRQLGEAHGSELSRAMDDERPSQAEAFLLVVGLAGGAGAGAAPPLAAELQRLYDTPVYALGILPAVSESEPQSPDRPRSDQPATDTDPPAQPLADKNAARTLDALSARCSAVFPFDIEAWVRPGEQPSAAYDRVNGAISERLAALFGAGETDDAGSTPQQVLDASDLGRAVGDDGAIAAIGYATQTVASTSTTSRFGLGLFESNEPADVDTSEAVSAIETVIRKATRGKSTIDVPDGAADRTLLVVGGPPEWLNREAIAAGRRWLTEETGSGAILSGDAPVPGGDEVFAVVVRSGIDDPARIRALRDLIA